MSSISSMFPCPPSRSQANCFLAPQSRDQQRLELVVFCSLFPYFLCYVFSALYLSLEFVSISSVFHLFCVICTHMPFELVLMGSLFPYFLCCIFSALNASLVYSLHFNVCLELILISSLFPLYFLHASLFSYIGTLFAISLVGRQGNICMYVYLIDICHRPGCCVRFLYHLIVINQLIKNLDLPLSRKIYCPLIYNSNNCTMLQQAN